jgi:hypothetical protein
VTDLILSLIRTNRAPMTLETLVHELTVMRSTVRKELPRITDEVVRFALEAVMANGHIALTSGGYQAVYPQRPQQREMFAEEVLP